MTEVFAFVFESSFWEPKVVGVLIDESGEVNFTVLSDSVSEAKKDLGFVVPVSTRGKYAREQVKQMLLGAGKPEEFSYSWIDNPAEHKVCGKFIKEQLWMAR